MSLKLYVGNYPSEFSRKDVTDLFREFDGVTLEKFFKKEKKCFSFINCKDIDQVVSIIQQMNDVTVSGRQLKVRASDAGLQEYVELLLQEKDDNTVEALKEAPFVPLQVLRNEQDPQNSKLKAQEQFETSSCHSLSPSLYNNVDQYNYVETNNTITSPFVPLQVWRNEQGRQNGKMKTHEQFEINSCHSSSPSLYSNVDEHNYVETNNMKTPPFVPLQVRRNERDRQNYKMKAQEQFEISSCHSSSPSLYSNVDEHNYVDTQCYSEADTASTRSGYKSFLPVHNEDLDLTWVSVTNFPLGTKTRSIYELFSDYDPIDVRMICNVPRRDKTLTEAHVCFLNREIADDVIMNFDNTTFDGRCLLVNDIDLTVMNELLNVTHS